jgi:hypothetical protein
MHPNTVHLDGLPPSQGEKPMKKTQYANVYEVNGSQRKVTPANGKKFDYKELQPLVGGYIEGIIPGIKGCRQMYCNEDGLSLGLQPNPHTWSVVNAKTYRLNGYGPEWRVSGPIVAIFNEEVA